ncbi:MAG: adenylyltransferase/cytidyltransferase family protein [Eubacteriales bacterium]|nr:adenylyltransferase/cytidyltransferase family protein [Eubacteriales bacterium]
MNEKRYKIGYTTGVYDMFHIGHLNILKKAKERCDYLIVGVSTDEVVQSYKHRTPIIPFAERIAIIRELRCVDQAVPQSSMNKMEAWKEYHFDALFHGSDWKGSEMYNNMIEQFAKVGVDVVFLPHTEGVSSTLLSEVLYKLKEESEEG